VEITYHGEIDVFKEVKRHSFQFTKAEEINTYTYRSGYTF